MTRKARGKWRTAAATGLAALLAVGAAAGVTLWMTRGGDPPPKDMPETIASEPPPAVDLPRTEAERIERLMNLLLSGDSDDAEWARGRLVAAGAPARTVVAETARRSLRSNFAFVEHAFDLLLQGPLPEDVPLAVEALASDDPQVVRRALLLLGQVRDDQVRAAAPQIAEAASASWPAPLWALDALVALGGEEAFAQVERIATSPDEKFRDARDLALAKLGAFPGERARTTLVRELAAAQDDLRFIAAASGLIDLGDPAPIERLRAMWKLKADDRALALLARARDDAALAECDTRIRAPVESEERLEQALGLLESYPFARRAPLLRLAAAPPHARGVRADAWVQLARDGDRTFRDELVAQLRVPGSDAREGRIVAALALPRLSDPAAVAVVVPALLQAIDANRGDAEIRTMLLRALVLVRAPAGAETVVRAMAADPATHGSPESVSFELGSLIAESPREFREACAAWIADALRGKLGALGPMATEQLIRAAGVCCGDGAAPLVEPYLVHEDRHFREAAADVLGNVPGPTTIAALRNAWWRRQDKYSREAIGRALVRAVLARTVE